MYHVAIIIKASYPDGTPVLLPSINVSVGNDNVTLLSNGDGVYSSVYSIGQMSDFNILMQVTDESNNFANESVTILVSGTSPLYYFKSYPYIVWPLVGGLVFGLVLFFLKVFKKCQAPISNNAYTSQPQISLCYLITKIASGLVIFFIFNIVNFNECSIYTLCFLDIVK